MNGFIARLTLVICFLLHFSTDACAGTLDDYYLQQFGETSKTIQLQKAILSVTPQAQESARCGMPLKHGLKRDWNLLEQTTQKVLAKQLALPTLADKAFVVSGGGHFKVHYATTGTDTPPLADTNSNGVPDWVETVATTFEDVYANYVLKGYRPAPTAGGAPYDIYLRDLAPQGYYGVTTSDQSASSTLNPNAVTSWLELDNNFTDSIYKPATYIPLQSLQITAAHEYHHAIQYGYNIFFDIWYAEATSTWMEDDLYDDVNQLYNYIPAWFNNSTTPLDLAVGSNAVSSGAGYGRWIFNRFLAEKHTPAMIRGVWEKVGSLPSPGSNADIPMVPVLDEVLSASYGSSLQKEFFEFTKRVYIRSWASHPADIPLIHPYSPIASYSVFPVDVNSPAAPAINLPHYSFAYFRFVPSPGAPADLSITVTGTSGITATAFRNNASVIVEFPFTRVDGATVLIPSFNTSTEIVLLITNATSSDNQSANFSTNGTGQPVVSTNSSGSGGGGGSSGCFIATAAYGSYLHPQVQLLRAFRDDYLMTNPSGRTFVEFYYRHSPPLADFIARHTLLRSVTRLSLTPIVVAITHPLISALSLFLLAGAILLSHLRRNRVRLNAPRQIIRTTSSRL